MADGTRGDHPITDVTIHRLPAFSPVIDELIREVGELDGWRFPGPQDEIAHYLLGARSEMWRLREIGDRSNEQRLLAEIRQKLVELRARLRQASG